jgi:hypothetical protein
VADTIRVSVVTTRAALEQDKEALGHELVIESILPFQADGSRLDRAHFVEAIAAVVGITIVALAKRIVEHRLTNSEQGVQIDTRTTPSTISYIANVPKGFIVIIDETGKPLVHQAKYESGADLERLLAVALQK